VTSRDHQVASQMGANHKHATGTEPTSASAGVHCGPHGPVHQSHMGRARPTKEAMPLRPLDPRHSSTSIFAANRRAEHGILTRLSFLETDMPIVISTSVTFARRDGQPRRLWMAAALLGLLYGCSDNAHSGDVGGGAGFGTSDATGMGGDTGANEATVDAGPVTILAPWDWAGVLGTGQSLAVGQMGTPAKATTQPYHNLKMSTGTAAWPIDATDSSFTMVPLTEPIGRPSTTYPSAYPTNIAGETPHAAMANQITALVMAAAGTDYLGVHGEFGENGQGLAFLIKNAVPMGVNGRAYQASLLETQAVTRLAQAANKTYGVGAIIVTHGETDAGNANYESGLYQLWSDYNADIAMITGQTQKILMIVSQQNSINDRSASTQAEWKIGADHPTDVVCSGPKYQYPYFSDHVHLVTDGYEQLGEKYGQVYYERVVLGNPWQPLAPASVERTSARVITVNFHVPVPPLVWDAVLPAPNTTVAAWSAGKGFEVRAGNAPVTISGVAISGDAVQITCASDLPPAGVVVGYAMTAGDANSVAQVTDNTDNLLWTGTLRWGQLQDSDPFVGSMSRRVQPNYAVAFEMPVP
jgi:hypothetical protein